MNTSKSIILKLVNNDLIRAMTEDRRATADHAATEAGNKAWDKANPEDGCGGISMNPYNVVVSENSMKLARENHNMMRKAYEYAVSTFI